MSFYVSLPMYDLPEIRLETQALSSALAAALRRNGLAAVAWQTDFKTHAELESHWRDPNLALSHACGLPYAESLRKNVEIVGTLLWTGVTDDAGWYQSRIVVSEYYARNLGLPTAANLDVALAGEKYSGQFLPSFLDSIRKESPRVVVNNVESLSGWASLGVALGLSDRVFDDYLVSGSHTGSLAALKNGQADIAAIDAVTFGLLKRYRPAALSGLGVVGLGPKIPATPLICNTAILKAHGIPTHGSPGVDRQSEGSFDQDVSIHLFRKSVCEVIRDPANRSLLDAIGIESITIVSERDYLNLTHIAERAEKVLPRKAARQIEPLDTSTRASSTLSSVRLRA